MADVGDATTRSSACARRTQSSSAARRPREPLAHARPSACCWCSAAGWRRSPLVAIWLRVTLLDTDRYVRPWRRSPPSRPVQDAVADKLETAIYHARRLRLAGPRGAARARRRAGAGDRDAGAQSFISDRITDFTRSPRFQELWVEANRRAHTRVVELLETGRSRRLALDDDTIYLDLSPAVDRVKARAAGTRAEPHRGRDPAERRRADRARAVRRASSARGARAAAEGDRRSCCRCWRCCAWRARSGSREHAPARVAARRDRRGDRDAAG